MTEEEFDQHPFILTFERMLSMHPKMTEQERNALAEWERVNLGPCGKGTSDWPGWSAVCARLCH
ncbi:hypothetical protein [Paracidovorax wautersii]|uniref:Uncharacterized protein n=1 Tax=Paracidovorax wautersii TaxID=1177982 RepID=A0A1I2HQG1_9BURK|nr:hypothetical protein [Paracidovorax wautersii]SFF32545.1 hypothetical protein SAMN04489711_1316 [Paracidovorax wautersii]